MVPLGAAFQKGVTKLIEQCKKAGLTFYYHHHNFEFDPKFRAIDLLHDKLGKDVKLEIDCFWASVGGSDPVTFIEQWNGRLFALHLKDKGKDTPNSYETDKVKHQEFMDSPSKGKFYNENFRNSPDHTVERIDTAEDKPAAKKTVLRKKGR